MLLRPGAEALAVAAAIKDLIEVSTAADFLTAQVIGQVGQSALGLDPGLVMLLEVNQRAGLFLGEGRNRHEPLSHIFSILQFVG
jgi:hypothetical protein